MGTSSYSVNDWNNYVRSTRLDTAVSAQQIYRSNYILPEFDPKNIKVRESCDSKEFPITTPIIIGLDVTGSMDPVLMTISKSLNDLMLKILNNDSIPGPHLMFMGIGDACCDSAPLQVTQFESDIKIAEQMNKIWFEQGGGGTSYSKDVFHNWKNLLHERAIVVDNVKNLSDIIYNTIAMNRNNLSNNSSVYSEFDL